MRRIGFIVCKMQCLGVIDYEVFIQSDEGSQEGLVVVVYVIGYVVLDDVNGRIEEVFIGEVF